MKLLFAVVGLAFANLAALELFNEIVKQKTVLAAERVDSAEFVRSMLPLYGKVANALKASLEQLTEFSHDISALSNDVKILEERVNDSSLNAHFLLSSALMFEDAAARLVERLTVLSVMPKKQFYEYKAKLQDVLGDYEYINESWALAKQKAIRKQFMNYYDAVQPVLEKNIENMISALNILSIGHVPFLTVKFNKVVYLTTLIPERLDNNFMLDVAMIRILHLEQSIQSLTNAVNELKGEQVPQIEFDSGPVSFEVKKIISFEEWNPAK